MTFHGLRGLKNEATSFLDQYKAQDPGAYAAAQQAVGGLLILDGFIGIDNPLGGSKRPGIFGSLIGIVVGIVFLFASPVIGNLTGLSKMTATTNANIISVSQEPVTRNSDGSESGGSCNAVASYTVDGHIYTTASSFGSSDMCSLSKGQTTQIHYNPNKPGQWATNTQTLGAIIKILPLFGAIVLLTSLFTFVIRLLSIIFGWKILQSGRALAKTLPQGTNLAANIKQIEQAFKTHVFGSGGTMPFAPAPQPVPAATAPQATTPPSYQNPAQQPMPPVAPQQVAVPVAPQPTPAPAIPAQPPQPIVPPAPNPSQPPVVSPQVSGPTVPPQNNDQTPPAS